MTDKSVDSLINSLSEELEPVKPLAHPLWRVVPLLFVSALYLGAMIMMLEPRHDWMDKMLGEIDYVFEFILSFSIFVSAAFALCWLSIPDVRGQIWVKAVPVSLLGVFIVWAILRSVFEWHQPLHFELRNCSMDGLFMTVLPVFALTFLARGGATTQPRWSSFMAILSFSGLGWAGLRFTCGANTFLQSLVIHFIPFILLGIVFGLFARRIFKW